MPYRHLSNAVACDTFAPNQLWDADFDEDETPLFGLHWTAAEPYEPDFEEAA